MKHPNPSADWLKLSELKPLPYNPQSPGSLELRYKAKPFQLQSSGYLFMLPNCLDRYDRDVVVWDRVLVEMSPFDNNENVSLMFLPTRFAHITALPVFNFSPIELKMQRSNVCSTLWKRQRVDRAPQITDIGMDQKVFIMTKDILCSCAVVDFISMGAFREGAVIDCLWATTVITLRMVELAYMDALWPQEDNSGLRRLCL